MCGLGRVGQVHQRAPARLEQRAARGRQLDVPAVTPQQLAAELLFEPPDLLAERGLRESEPLRGLAEVQRLRHGDEAGQAAGVENG